MGNQLVTHITASDMTMRGLDLNRTLHRIVQSTLNREYKKEVAKYTQDQLDTEGTWTKIQNNYVARAHDKLVRKYGVKTTNVNQPDGSVKQVVELQLKKYHRDDNRGGQISEFFGNYTMYFHMHTHKQIQAGEAGIEFLKGTY